MNTPPIDRKRLLRALNDLLELDAPQREAALATIDDEQLRVELQRRLQAIDDPSVLDCEPNWSVVVDASDLGRAQENALPKDFAAYRFVRHLGNGGMSRVFLAQRVVGEARQDVAFKQLCPELFNAAMTARFLREQRVLARLSHPNIARLIDAGVDNEATPYLAMEYIEGKNVLQHADANQLDLRARLKMFQAICEAVQHAHQNLIVHRDLKPSNIMIDGDTNPKLLDFGIAGLLEPDALDAGLAMSNTQSRWQAFTPDYAAPEQMQGGAASTAMDVYALGIILYELLSGRHPRRLGQAANTTFPAPSQALTIEPQAGFKFSVLDLAHARASEPTRLRRALAGDPDAIVMKALREEPSARYSSAAEMSQDIQRFLDGNTVHARRGNRRYRTGKFLRRHAWAVGFGVVAALSLLIGSALSWHQAARARTQEHLARVSERDAREALARAENFRGFLLDVFANAEPGDPKAHEPTVRDVLRAGITQARERQDDPVLSADVLSAIGWVHLNREEGKQAEPLFLDALARLTPLKDTKPIDYALAQINLAARYTRQDAFDQAHHHLDAAIKTIRATPTTLPNRARALERGLQEAAMLADREDQQAQRLKIEAEHWHLVSNDSQFTGRKRLAAANNYANGLNANGQSQAALQFNQIAFDESLNVYGKDHFMTAVIRANLGGKKWRAGAFVEAAHLLETSMAAYKSQTDKPLSFAAVATSNLSELKFDLGQEQAALDLQVEATEMWRRIVGTLEPDVIHAQTRLPYLRGRIALQHGEYKTALAHLEEAARLALRDTNFPADEMPDVLAHHAIALCFNKQDHLATKQLTVARDKLKNLKPQKPEHEAVVDWAEAICLQQQNQAEAALTLLAKWTDVEQKFDPWELPQVAARAIARFQLMAQINGEKPDCTTTQSLIAQLQSHLPNPYFLNALREGCRNSS